MMQIKFEIFEHNKPVVTHILSRASMKVGRLTSCSLPIDDPTVSRLHAILETIDDVGLRVIDLGSLHGTRVKGVKVDKADLTSGDEIVFGRVLVRVTFPYLLVEYVPPRIV